MTSRETVYADRTIAAYRAHARTAIADWAAGRHPSAFLRRFAHALPGRGRILDYGCGIGRDLAWLARRGFRVEGMDGTLEFVLEARRRCPHTQIAHARFETWPIPAGRYDGIWCHAALIHVPPVVLRRRLEPLRDGLVPGGLLGLTLAWGRRKGIAPKDWIPGRYLAGYTTAEALALLKGWTVREGRVAAHDGRQGRWIQIIVQ